MNSIIICIDPGLSGGIAWQDKEGVIHAEPMPEGMTAQDDMIREISGQDCCVCLENIQKGTAAITTKIVRIALMEKTGTYYHGESAPNAVKFSRHCGNLESALYLCGFSAVQVPPIKWQSPLPLTKFPPIKRYDPRIRKVEIARRKTIHKREIKEEMQRRYPHLRVTLKIADALGILTWGMR
ncbi:MAG: hypothetical protein ABH868_04505 [bacterium]